MCERHFLSIVMLHKFYLQTLCNLYIAFFLKFDIINLRTKQRKVIKIMNKVLVFDMDGTIADLYKEKNWLEDIKAEKPNPYQNAKPLYEMDILKDVLEVLKGQGWKIVVTSWLAKGSTKAYDEKVRKAKTDWLRKYDFPYDELHLVKYGTTKANCTRKYGGYQILVDDNKKVRKGWTLGKTIDANKDILFPLVDLALDKN